MMIKIEPNKDLEAMVEQLDKQTKPESLSDRLNDICKQLLDIQMMTDFLGWALTSDQSAEEKIKHGGKLCFGLLDKQITAVYNQVNFLLQQKGTFNG